jgi:hypothetical protein
MTFGEAVVDIRYLLDRGYQLKGAIGFVCDHYRLNDDSRRLLSRTVLAKAVSEKRKRKFLPCDKIYRNTIMIDGYNILIGMESILENKAYLCDDGVIRDIKGTFRNYRTSKNTDKGIEVMLQFLKEKKPAYVSFLLDSQISRSGLLAESLRNKINEAGLSGDARTSKHVDYDLKSSKYIVASSDGVIIDEAEKVVNFLYCIVARFRDLEGGVRTKII